ncbi:pyrroline-5-carboxylate reductase [Kaarinaea lacus]
MKNVKLAFIGGGNMAASLIGGLVADNFDPNHISVADPVDSLRENLAARFGIHTSKNNLDVVADADVVVLAVKPQQLKAVAQELSSAIQESQPLVVSVAAGIRSDVIDGWLGGNLAVVRTMPNTPALVQSGATALYANSQVSEDQRDLAESILRAAGLTLWLDDESLMDAVTALSGSGPAYFFRIMEAIESAGIKLGLPPETARLLTLQTAFGAAKMALESSESAATLRENVTSPGGTTEQGLRVLDENNIDRLFNDVLGAARDRSEELAKLLGDT